MIENMKLLVVGLVLFTLSAVMTFPFPNRYPLGETIAMQLDIPATYNGLHFVNIAAILLFIISLFFLTRSLKRYHKRVVVLAIVVIVFVPTMLVSAYQHTIATGVHAVNYEQEWSSCVLEMVGESTMDGECELPFENYSNDKVQFTVELYEDIPEGETPMVSLMNNGEPYEVELMPHERKIVKINKEIDVSNTANHIEWGQAWEVDVIIKSGEMNREL
ncbi:hypothetical protein SFC66_11460 [Terribacillus saccharophilus]|uniref:hypothetical protein n=1 Tax=Terribacillus saccharophilus TaxID=361277 RepID=UPI003982CA92